MLRSRLNALALNTAPPTKHLKRAIPVLAILGAGISGYLTYTYWTAGSPFCGGIGSCAKVEASPYANIRGVPVALLGLLMYLSVAGLGAWNLVKGGHAALLGVAALAFSGVVFSSYLTYRSIFTIQSVCPWCVASAITVTAIFGVSLALLARETGDNLSPSQPPSNLRKTSSSGR